MQKNIGTNEVEHYVKNMCKHNVRKNRNVGMIRSAMKVKLEDAEYDEKQTRKLFNAKFKEYRNCSVKGSVIDEQFNKVMRHKVEEIWRLGKEKNKQKVERLVQKYSKGNTDYIVDGEIRNVGVTDEKLALFAEHNEKNVKVYGDVTIYENEKAALKIDPEYRVYKRVNEIAQKPDIIL